MSAFENTILPVAAVAIIIAVMILIGKKNSGKNRHFDEMQLKIRAEGYRIGFFVTLIGLFIMTLLTELTDIFGKMIAPSVSMWIAGFAGLTVFVVYCIFKDAFYSIGQNRKSYMILCVCIILANGIGAVGQLKERELSGDGLFTFSSCSNLICAACFLIILVSLFIKEAVSRKEVEE